MPRFIARLNYRLKIWAVQSAIVPRLRVACQWGLLALRA
jgi:hypothetical protein